MSDKLNQQFQSAPFAFIQNRPVNNVSMKLVEEKSQSDFKADEHDPQTGKLVKSHYSPYKNAAAQAKQKFDLQKMGLFDIQERQFVNCTNYYLRYYSPDMCSMLNEAPIMAYWCPYDMMQGTTPDQIPYVDLPKSDPVFPLMLTGSMQGCSLVVTLRENDPTVIRVYHDFRHKTDSFKNELVICRIDYTNEGYDSRDFTMTPRPALQRAASGSGFGKLPAYVPDDGNSYTRVAPLPSNNNNNNKSTGGANVLFGAPPSIRFSYGDDEAFKKIDKEGTKATQHGVKLSTAFNFLYFDKGIKKWVAVSQPLDFDFSGTPKQGFLEPTFIFRLREDEYNSQVQKVGQSVALAPRRQPWQEVIPY